MSRRACILGHPVAHSRSPLIHGTWLAEFGLDGSYERLDVAPADLAAVLNGLAERGFAGGNVTVPHKEAAAALVQASTPVARALDAVNTLWLEDGRLHGTNTDVEGFLASLDAGAPGWDHALRRAVVLGAGGAARAVVHALLERGAEQVVVANRTLARAEDLVRRFGGRVHALAWQEAPAALGDAGLLVNTTALGMAGQPPLALDFCALPVEAVVTDIVYVPLVTPLLDWAGRRGNRVVDGLGMLLHQAVPGFERWFGVRPAVTPALRASIVADLEDR